MNRIIEKYPVLLSFKNLTLFYCGVVVLATIHRLWLFDDTFNNFDIFRFSFLNLVEGKDLYALHPDQYFDLYKYSPTFAMLMAPFYLLPRTIGVFVFNLLNALLPLWAVNRLAISSKAKSFFLLFIAIELLSSIQNAQSNGIIAGLIIGAFSAMERKQVVFAALLICLGFYIKLFAIAAGIIFLFYDQKPKFLLACIFWGILLGVLPLLLTGYDGIIFQYKSWLHLLANDPAHELNFSIMTLTQRWFNFAASDSWYLIPGGILLLIPILRKDQWSNFSFRLLYLALILVWVVIFNHKAESPTYVIAVSGVAFWAMMEEKKSLRIFILWFVFVFTILSPTDLFPSYLRIHLWQPYCLKALPCIVVWVLMTWALIRKNFPARVI
ncbi:glycosyltransferase family 87 protein [soil metagenome]